MLSIEGVRSQARCLIEWLRGLGAGASAALRRRQWVSHEEQMLGRERMAHLISLGQGHYALWQGQFPLWFLTINYNPKVFFLKNWFFFFKTGGTGVQNSWKCLGAKILWLAKCVNCVILPAYVKARRSRHFANIRQSTKIKSFLSSLPGTFSSISFYAFPQALVPTWGKVYYV